MLRGIDAKTARGDDAAMVNVADRVDLVGEITVYVREDPPSYVSDRQRAVHEVFETLEAAGVLDPVPVVEWPEQVTSSAGEDAEPPLETYREFVDAVGRRALEPFFERRAATGSTDSIVELPAVCIALRADGAVRGLYPCWQEGTHHSIEDCIAALSRGDDIANVDPDR
ncbi:HTH domain-containing protein [Natronomonas sp.]|uniref:HTH domain-containing protein n=1 Tax=Natronomonas sp. TaxID=2184060 RepID=UPI002FC28905